MSIYNKQIETPKNGCQGGDGWLHPAAVVRVDKLARHRQGHLAIVHKIWRWDQRITATGEWKTSYTCQILSLETPRTTNVASHDPWFWNAGETLDLEKTQKLSEKDLEFYRAKVEELSDDEK